MLFSEMVGKAGKKIKPFRIKTDFEINKLCYNSKLVEPNDVFFAVKGFKSDGNIFIHEAASGAAGAIITDSPASYPDLPVYAVDNVRRAMAIYSGIFYDSPSEKMRVIGVTGTNGKTTVTSIINHVLESAGKKTGLLGTNKYVIAKRNLEASHTTPESVDLNALLHTMNFESVEFVTMEVSSHSLSLDRVYGVDFDTVVFMNLSPDHLDFHHSMTEYFAAKKLLFDSMSKVNAKGYRTHAVYNKDDNYGQEIMKNTKSEISSFGFDNADYTAANTLMSFDKMHFDLSFPGGKINITSNLTGKFNAYNLLAAVATLRTFDIPMEQITSSIESFPPVDGRFNVIRLPGDVVVIIDYAHTPDSLYNVLITIKEILEHSDSSKSRIITVFGCGGDRDKTKRPAMGAIAAKYSDFVIVTSDNPRFENPMEIINDIRQGIESENYSVEPDRIMAINKAIKMGRSHDVILIAGKGHEPYQEVGGIRHHLSDREIVENLR